MKYIFTLLILPIVLLLATYQQSAAQCSNIQVMALKNKVCRFNSVTFVALGAPSGSEYTWVFDGDTVKGKNIDTASFIAKSVGTFNLSFEVQLPDNKICAQNLNKVVEVGAIPSKTAITASQSSVCELPKTITFKSNTTQNLTYEWSVEHLGDPSKNDNKFYSTKSNSVNHTIQSNGYKSLIVRAINPNGCDLTTKIDSIVFAYDLPNLEIETNETVAECEKKYINFKTNISNLDGAKLSWTFEGAFPDTSSAEKPKSVYYKTAGDFDVNLTLSTQGGCKTSVLKKDFIKVGKEIPLSIDVQDEGCTNDDILFTNTSQNISPDGEVKWIFPAATVNDKLSNRDSQFVKFSSPGTYDVFLRYDYGGCISEILLKDTVKIRSLSSNFIFDHNCNCLVPDVLLFSNKSKSNIASEQLKYQWELYNSDTKQLLTSSNNTDISFSFNQYGKYGMELTTTNEIGCERISKQSLNFAPLKAAFAPSKKSYCMGEEVAVSLDQSITCDYRLKTVHWLFYNSDDSKVVAQKTGNTAKYKYTEPGKYSIACIVENQQGCTDTLFIQDAIEMYKMEVEILTNDEYLCIGDEVKLNVDYKPFPMSSQINWFINDPNTGARYTSQQANLKFAFADAGTYNVFLSSYISKECSDTAYIKGQFKVSGVKADILSVTTESCLPLLDTVTAETKYNIHHQNPLDNSLTYKWTSNSTNGISIEKDDEQISPIEINKNNFYDLNLSIENADGCITTLNNSQFYSAGVAANYSMPAVACKNIPFYVNNKSFVNPTQYKWQINTQNVSFSPNANAKQPELLFDTIGDFDIQLVVENAIGCKDSIIKPITIIDFDFDFESPDTNGICSPAFVRFYAHNVNVDSFIWDFGDGKKLRTQEDTVAHLYDIQGLDLNDDQTFNVTLVAISKFGCYDTLFRKAYITVWGPQPKFVMKNTKGTGKVLTEFINLNKGVSRFYINYGDLSSIDSNQFQNHLYELKYPNLASNVYKPFIIAFDDRECMAVYTPDDSVVVYNYPVPNFTADTTKACDSIELQLLNTSIFSDSFEWYLNDADTVFSTEKNPIITLQEGRHTIKLVAINEYGSKRAIEKIEYIEVYALPQIGIDVSDSIFCTNKEIYFFDKTIANNDIISWKWNLNSGTSDSILFYDQNPIYKYSQDGTYSIWLSAIDRFGCKNQKEFKDYIKIGPPTPIVHPGLSYVSFLDNNTIQLSWDDAQSQGIKKYLLYEQNLGVEKSVQLVGVNSDSNLVADTYTTYNNSQNRLYYLKAINECKDTVTIGNQHIGMDISLSYTSQNYFPNLKWTPYQGWDEVSAYQIYRQEGTDKYKQIAKLDGQINEFIDSFVCNNLYTYKVEAIKANSSFTSTSRSDTTSPNYTPPTGAVDLFVTTVDSNHTITSWYPHKHPKIESYTIGRYSTDLGKIYTYREVRDTFMIDDDAYTDNIAYSYRVYGKDFCENITDISNTGNSIVLRISRSGDDNLVKWNRFFEWPTIATSYQLQRRTTNEDWKTIISNNGNDTSYVDKGIYQDEQAFFEYRVIANFQNKISISNVVSQVPDARIFIPNAFSPNGDGVNDVFKIIASAVDNGSAATFDKFTLKIINRWGELVYESNDIHEGWDGSFRNKYCPVGNYIYYAEVRDLNGEFYYYSGNLKIVDSQD